MKKTNPLVSKIRLVPLLGIVLAACLAGVTGCSTSKPSDTAAAPAASTNGAGAAVIEAFTASATVVSIDAQKRIVVLQREDGSKTRVHCGPEVVNFDQIKVGDIVTVTTADEFAVVLTPGGIPPAAGEATVIVRAPKGAMPGVRMVKTVGFVAKVLSIDTTKRVVGLLGPDGETHNVHVGPDINLARIAVGDDVGVQLTEAIAISLERPAAPQITAAEAHDIGVEAYIYGYPLVTMEITRRVMTNVEKPEGTRAPMGQIVRMREYPTAAFRDVTAPNADTLYTTAWMDVSKEPWILSLPDAHGRYYLMPMLDGWTDVFQVPGKRTTGTDAQIYAITGPNWTGTLPEGVTQYKSPTAIVWLLGRIYCTGTPEDYAAVHALQDQVTIVPLSSYGKPYTPPAGTVDASIDMKTPVREQVNALGVNEYFSLLSSLMKENPAAAADAPALARFARIGFAPGQPFDASKLGDAAAKALQDVPKIGFEKIMAWFKESALAGVNKAQNGWLYTTQTGIYGTNYLQRALITAIGLGANRPQDAVYPTSEAAADGQPYIGTNHYVMHFDKDSLPPAEAFWSLTMYDAQFFFVDNPLNRYTLSSRNQFVPNADGSVDLYLQHESPGADKEANWLPAPEGRFILMLRLYWPRESSPSLLDGTWTLPAVQLVP